MPKRKLNPRPTYRQRSDKELSNDIKARIMVGTPLWDYLTEERLAENFGANEWERGIVEGARRFAGRLQDIVLDQTPDTPAMSFRPSFSPEG